MNYERIIIIIVVVVVVVRVIRDTEENCADKM
jgi:hypothetical protein